MDEHQIKVVRDAIRTIEYMRKKTRDLPETAFDNLGRGLASLLPKEEDYPAHWKQFTLEMRVRGGSFRHGTAQDRFLAGVRTLIKHFKEEIGPIKDEEITYAAFAEDFFAGKEDLEL